MRGLWLALALAACTHDAPKGRGDDLVQRWIQEVQSARTWSISAELPAHRQWLEANVAWDVVGAIRMTHAVQGFNGDPDTLNRLLGSGLAELAAGRVDSIGSISAEARALGMGECKVASATAQEEAAVRRQLDLPALPAAARPEHLEAVRLLRDRAQRVERIQRVSCGAAPVFIGLSDDGGRDRLVPLLLP